MVIVNWNQKELLHRLLETLRITNYPSSSVVVVDNGSTDSSVEMIEKEFEWVHLVANAGNLGYPRAVNQGISYAIHERADYVLVMNNDMECVHPDWLTRLIMLAEANSDFGIVGPKLLRKRGGVSRSAWIFKQPFSYVAFASNDQDKSFEVDYVMGSALLIRMEVIQKIGFFDEAYSPTLIDDIDYCMRAKRAGFRIIYYTGASLVHVGSASLRKVAYYMQLAMMYTNLMRFRLLYYRRREIVPSLTEMLLMCLFRRVDNTKALGLGNMAFQREPGAHFYYFARALAVNFKQLRSIMWRRVRNSVYVATPSLNPQTGLNAYEIAQHESSQAEDRGLAR
jgi:GT2 family glycosyltransferase